MDDLDKLASDIDAAIDAAINPSPLDAVEYTGNIEADTKAEVTAVQQAFRDRTKAEAKRFQDATDSEYWVALCFRTRADKDAFLLKFNLLDLGDKYLSGHDVDARLSGSRAPAVV